MNIQRYRIVDTVNEEPPFYYESYDGMWVKWEDVERSTPAGLLSLDTLIDELESRFDDCIILGRRIVDVKEKTYAYRRAHKGEYESVFFLMDHAKFELNKDYHESRRDPEPWEEL